jgi:GAF domain-containing protein
VSPSSDPGLTLPADPFDERVRSLELVYEMAVTVAEAHSLAVVYDQALHTLIEATGADRASVLRFDADGVMRFKASRGLSDAYCRAVEGHSPWTADTRDPDPVLVPEVVSDAGLGELRSTILGEGIGALAFIPLTHRGRLVGKFMLYYDEPHAFSDHEIQLARTVASHIALGIVRCDDIAARREGEEERARLLEAERAARLEAEASARRLATLQRVTAELSQAVSLDEVAGVVLGTALSELGANTGSLCLLDGDQLEIAYASGYPEAVTRHWRRFPLDADLPASECVRSGRGTFISTPEERDARYPIFAQTPVLTDPAFASVPLADVDPPGCLIVGFAEPRTFSEQDRAFISMLARQCGAALERGRLFDERERAVAAEAAAHQAAEQARVRVSFLAETSATLASSLDYEQTLNKVAELAVPRLADWCGIYLTAEDGGITPVAIAHADPSRLRFVRELLERFPVRSADPAGVAAVIRTGRPEVYPEVPEELWTAMAHNDEHLRLLRSVGLGSGMVVPLRARDRIVGAFTLGNDRGRLMASDDVSLVEELAVRASVAIDNARLFTDRAYVARTLQESLMPPGLPQIPGLDLAARYHPASHEVGGDFYDVFPLSPGRWLMAVGDVCGKGPKAAALTGSIRSALRAVAMYERDPSRILQGVNDAMRSQFEASTLFTMVAGVFDRTPRTLRFTVSCGGHPPPLVVRAHGEIETGGTEGTLLGIFPNPALSDRAVDVGKGDAIVFFTDGATNQRVPDEAARLARVLQQRAGAAASDLAETVIDVARRQQSHDDVAALVLRMPS